MKFVADVIASHTDRSVLTLMGKDVIYFREDAKRHMWVGKIIDITMNGATVLFRNGVQQGYSMTYFRQCFCPCHWKDNVNVSKLALNYADNALGGRALLANYWPEDLAKALAPPASLPVQPKPEKASIADLGEFYVWRKGGPAPTKAHLTLQDAVSEGERLSKLHPGNQFLILSVMADCTSVPVTTHQLQLNIR